MDNNQKNWIKITNLKTKDITYWNMNQMNWIKSRKDIIAFRLATDKEMITFHSDEYKIELVSSINIFPSATTLFTD